MGMKTILWGYIKSPTNDEKRIVDPERAELCAMIYYVSCLMDAKGEPADLIAHTVANRYGISIAESKKAVFDVLEHLNIYENGNERYQKHYGVAGVHTALMGGRLNKFGGELIVSKRLEKNREIWLGLCESDNPHISRVRDLMKKALPKDVQLSFVVPPNITPCKGFYRKLLDAVKPTNIILNDDRALFPWFNDYQDFLSVVMYHSEISIDKHLFIVNQHYEKKIFRNSQFDWYIPQYPWSEKKGTNNGESI